MLDIVKKIPIRYQLLYWFVYLGINNTLYYLDGYKFFFLSTVLYNFSLFLIFYVTLISASYTTRTNNYTLSILMIICSYAISSYISKWLLENTSLYAPIYPEEKNLSIFVMFYDYFPEYMDNTIWPIIFVVFIHNKEKYAEEKSIIIEKQILLSNSAQLENNYIDIDKTFKEVSRLSNKHFKEIYYDIIEINALFNYYTNTSFYQLVTIEEEIKVASYFININQKRHHNIFKIKKSFNILNNSFLVPNMIILTLLENAFKHGDIVNDHLIIDINVDNKKLEIFIRNKKNVNKIADSTFLGIKNLKRRLDILIEGKYSYVVKSDDKYYQTRLQLNN